MKQWKRIGTIKFFIYLYGVSCGDGLVHSNGSASRRKLVDVNRPPLLASTTLRRDNTEDLNLATSWDLVADWNRRSPGQPLPVKVIDLVGIFENILRGPHQLFADDQVKFRAHRRIDEYCKGNEIQGIGTVQPKSNDNLGRSSKLFIRP